MLVLTGFRKEEAAKLRWADVDLIARSVTIREAKNWEPHTLPLSDYLVDLLHGRREETAGDYVFPGDGAAGHIVELSRQMKRVTQQSESLALHDLRRTFATVAGNRSFRLFSQAPAQPQDAQ